MAAGRLHSVLGFLRSLAGRPASDEATDRALLEEFVANRNQASFEALVKRHGPMVLGVCRRILGDSHQVEDVFQAVFIVLARKASTLRRSGTLAGWLYTVAVNAARKAKKREQRRREVEQSMLPISTANASGDQRIWNDIRQVIDEEVSLLPERYRLPFILCTMQGKTNEEAARELGCPTGTILSRLSRAKERLRRRLTRRGITVPLGTLVAVIEANVSQAVPPATLIAPTVELAIPQALGNLALEVPAVILARGVLHAMWIKRVAIGVLTIVAIASLGGATWLTFQQLHATPSDVPDANVAKPPAKSDVKKAEDAIRQAVKAFKSATLLSDPRILRTFPDYLFFDVRFRYNYGVPLGEIEGSACWAVNKKTGKTIRLGQNGEADTKELIKFFETNMAPVNSDAVQKEAVWACLRIAQEAFTEHGWMSMTIKESDILVGNVTAIGKSVVTPKGGNSGELIVYLAREDGNKATVRIENKIRRGPKPICQATRLLDPDPILCRICEQQLLLIGVHADDYLADRRARAETAELRNAIDRIWQRIVAGEEAGELVRPPERLLRHTDPVVRRIAVQQLRMMPTQ
ncbi:MAG: hypothetical protein KatS3mg105_1205 [Gemmatales bacterium]|nr:MAG: hypothetical protein KatS3mg105_1205 [Gemmatales bacterium]